MKSESNPNRFGLRYTGYRSLTALSKGETPGPENSIGKLVAASKTQDMASFAMDLHELGSVVTDPAHAEAHGLFGVPSRDVLEVAADLHSMACPPHQVKHMRH